MVSERRARALMSESVSSRQGTERFRRRRRRRGKREVPVEVTVVEKEGEGAMVSKAVRKVPAEAVEKAAAAEAEAGKPEEKESGRMIILKSSDGDLFEVTAASARLSKTIGNMIDDGCADPYIPLADVDSKTLKKVIEYCDKHANNKSDTSEEKEELKNWDKAFIDELDEDTDSLIEVFIASNYLKTDGLQYLACKRVSEIFKTFNISE